jgi:hypothetical protein
MAFANLRKALDSEDPEVVYRAERILLYQGQQVATKKKEVERPEQPPGDD